MERGKLKQDLEWGQTPWDDMTREELLVEVWRLYEAAIACSSALSMSRSLSQDGHPYWSRRGTGGLALHLAEEALSGLRECDEYRERIYRCFFRYATDLLFSPDAGSGWWVCEKCGDMWGSPLGGVERRDKCERTECGGQKLRPLRWDDLRKPAIASTKG